MATIQGQIYSMSAVASLDAKYGPYDSVEEAHELLATYGYNVQGLTVGIRNAETGEVEDYWYYKGTELENLVVKMRYNLANGEITINGEIYELSMRRKVCREVNISLVLNVLRMSCDTPGATILYTKSIYDEETESYPELETPTYGNAFIYNGPIDVVEGDNYAICAIAVKPGLEPSQPTSVIETPGERGGISNVVYNPNVNIPEGHIGGGNAESIKDNGRIDF